MTDKNLQTVNDIKIMSLLLIILSHCMFFYDDNPFFVYKADVTSPSVSFAVGVIDAVLIAAYVMCSGFLFARSQERHNRSIPTVLKGRAKRLLVPYYLYGALWLVPLYTYFDIVSFGRPEHAGYLEGYKVMALGQFSDHLWFLWMLFDVCVVFAFMKVLINKNRLILTGIITLAAALVVSLLLQDFPYFKVSQIAPYLICFYTGICVYKNGEKIRGLGTGACIAISVVLFAIVCAYVYFAPEHWAYLYVLKPVGGLFVFFLFHSFVGSSFWERFKTTGVYKYMGDTQMDFYLLHMPAPFLVFGILDPYIGKQPWLCVVVNFMIVMLITAVIVYIKRKLAELLSDAWNRFFPAGER